MESTSFRAANQYLVFILWISTTAVTISQEISDSIWRITLDSLEVRSSRLNTGALITPRSISVIDASKTNSGNQLKSFQEVLSLAPGVTSMNSSNFAQDLRISIRGFGARSSFGIRGIKIIYDGVPATTPDGQSQVDHLDLHDLERIEILRAGSAGLYGNAAGGVIHIQSAQPDEDQIRAGLSAGSDGLFLSHLGVFRMDESSSYSLGGSYSSYKGYRAHSSTESIRLKGKYQRLIRRGHWAVAGQYTKSPQADDPGGLQLAEAEADRRQARDRNIIFNAGERVDHLILSTHLAQDWDESRLTATAFYQMRRFANKLPFEAGGVVEFDRHFTGSSLNYELDIGSSSLLLGSDLEWQIDNRQRFDNVSGSKGSLALDQQEKFNSQGIYAISRILATNRINIEISARLDHLTAQIDDKYLSDGDQSGDRAWWHLSPSAGLSVSWRPSQMAFVHASHSFETPSLTELGNNPVGTGGFNPDLKPQLADQIEVGVKGVVADNLNYQMALFHIKLRNELVPFELMDSPGRTFYRNAGKSRRTGVEIGIVQQLKPSIQVGLTYTYADYSYNQFLADGLELDGNDIPGQPKHQLNLVSSYLPDKGLYAHLEVWYLGSLFADDGNMDQIEGYTLVHPRIGWKWLRSNKVSNIFVGLRNATGKKYFDNIRINAFGGRYYEPAARAEWFAGITMTF